MGNQLASIAPTQILPLESYFIDLQEYSKPISLGSTRFLKVARATFKSHDDEVVVKVFARHDSSIPLRQYEKLLHDTKVKLHGVANALPFQKFWESDKAGYLVRLYTHYNLYDRMSTRPFLNVIEKKWIVFQLLKALEECHSKKVYHGDIKTENVLLTGWNWVLLSDFANFKPTLLPADNPADYAFFFDTSRRRTCYLAPERFMQESSDPTPSSPQPATPSHQHKHLTGAMDIFSLGCVIVELFTDGRPPFNLSQLLEYCNGTYKYEEVVQKIPDKHIRRMVRHMLQPKPEDRHTATQYLDSYKGNVFPEFFYSFLHSYLKYFTIQHLTPDQCIQRLYGDFEATLANLVLTKAKLKDQVEDSGDSVPDQGQAGDGQALVIILAAITSHLRVSKYASSKLQALEMIKRISHYIGEECILENVVPYLVLLVKDKWSSVRAAAVRMLTHCIQLVKNVCISDLNLFPEYILPNLQNTPTDPHVIVRIALAECVADLAMTAHRFLEHSMRQRSEVPDEAFLLQYQVQGGYDSEMNELYEAFQSLIAHLLGDADSSVKKTFMKHSSKKLCSFFGPQRAKEVVLPHMITVLNIKTDWELHAIFFDVMVDVATYIGPASLPLLKPLLFQGLCDPEEAVVAKTINAISSLCDNRLFDVSAIVLYLNECSPFLLHPNIWIRYGAVGFLCAAARQMDDVDGICYLQRKLGNYMKYPVVMMEDELVVLNALKDPVPRDVLDFVLKNAGATELYDYLTKRSSVRAIKLVANGAVEYPPASDTLTHVYKKLQSLGLTDEHENALLALKDHISKLLINKRTYAEVVDQQQFLTRGVVDLDRAEGVTEKCIPLEYNRREEEGPGKADPNNSKNEEWDYMFSDLPNHSMVEPLKAPEQLTDQGPPIQVKADPVPVPGGGPKAYVPVSEGRGCGSSGSTPQEHRTTDEDLCMLQEMAVPSPSPAFGPSPSPALDPSPSPALDPSPNPVIQQQQQNLPSKNSSHGNYSAQISFGKVEHTGTCLRNLDDLLQDKKEQYIQDMRTMDHDLARNACFQSSPNWSPRGQLVAHMSEHRAAINKICVMQDSTIFVTFSDDGTTKVWDILKPEGKHTISRSKHTYSHQKGKMKSGTFCCNNKCVAAASDQGFIRVFDLETSKAPTRNSRKVQTLRNEFTFDPVTHGTVVDMSQFTSGGQNVLCLATTRGKLCGVDLRSNRGVWNLTNNGRFGLTLSMAVDPLENWVAIGTSLGYHVVWDMRFQLPIRHWQHTGHGKTHIHHVYQLKPHPTQPSSIISAVSGNNEVSIWDMETATRRQMLWTGPAQPFGEMSNNPAQLHSVRGMTTCIVDNSPVVLTGGTDRTIRLWNLLEPSQCSHVVNPANSKNVHASFKTQVIEGVEVFREMKNPQDSGSSNAADEQTDTESHVDFITDLAINQQFIVSASHDGILKLWK